jgi:hypothetical protein
MTVCPQCGSETDAGSGGVARCLACGTRWFVRDFRDDPYRRVHRPEIGRALIEVSEAVVIEERSGRGERRLPPPMFAGTAKPPRQLIGRRLKGITIVLGVLAAFFVLRAPIVAALPELRGLPAEAGLLEFRNVRSETVLRGGFATLFIEGEVVNKAAGYVDLPAIRVTLKSNAGEPVTSWLVEPSVIGLGPSGAIGFRSALAAPPDGATQVTLALARRGEQPQLPY